MSKTRVKLLLAGLLLILLAAALWFMLRGLGDLIAYFQAGANPASALNIVPNVPPDLQVSLTWLPDDEDTGRKMEPFTRGQIEAAYLRAWLQWNLSYAKDEPYGLKTYFVGPALVAASEAVTRTVGAGWRVSQADLSHVLQLHFYSADGSIVSFTDDEAVVAQTIRDMQRMEVFAGETTAGYDVVMFLEDGNWRVRHWVRKPAGAGLPDLTVPVLGSTAPITTGIAGINYYPRDTPWDAFWNSYDPQVIDRDLALVRSLGINTIRIFVPYETFGGAHVKGEMLARLADFLGRAKSHDLRVIVTLFDFRSDYSLLLWPAADRHMATILTRFRDDQTVLAWDLKNEPDLDYARAGRATVDTWLAHIARLARVVDPNHPVTIGWSSPQAAAALADSVDIVSFHFYAPAAELPARYAALRAAIPHKPILLSEFGLPTWNSFFFSGGHSEPEQAVYYADVLAVLRETDSVGYLDWTLHDFPKVPATIAGRLPWQIGPQTRLGIVRSDGKLKPAARLLAPGASLTVTRTPAWARLLKPFWLTMFSVLALGAAALVRVAQRKPIFGSAAQRALVRGFAVRAASAWRTRIRWPGLREAFRRGLRFLLRK